MSIQLPHNLALDNDFWQFSLSFWQQETAQETLLRLQNSQDFRVNLLLFSMWLGLNKQEIYGYFDQINLATEPWNSLVVVPLRAVRKIIPKHSPIPSLKSQIQQGELLAEQIEQALLFDCAQNIPQIDTQKIAHNTLYILSKNLLAYSDYHAVQKKADKLSKSDLLLLIQACLPAHPSSHITACIEALVSH